VLNSVCAVKPGYTVLGYNGLQLWRTILETRNNEINCVLYKIPASYKSGCLSEMSILCYELKQYTPYRIVVLPLSFSSSFLWKWETVPIILAIHCHVQARARKMSRMWRRHYRNMNIYFYRARLPWNRHWNRQYFNFFEVLLILMNIVFTLIFFLAHISHFSVVTCQFAATYFMHGLAVITMQLRCAVHV